MRPRDAHVLRKSLAGHELNGELEAVSQPYRLLVENLLALPLEDRQKGFDCFLCGRSDRDELVKTLADDDPDGPLPEAGDDSVRCATLADLRGLVANTQWFWPDWLASGVLNALAADPGTGKTILAFNLAFALWFKRCWPDGQTNPLAERTRTLWVPGDRHYPQLIDLADSYGLPDEAILFNASVVDPTAGLDLDEPDELNALGERIRAESPGLVIIDTVGMTTARNLCRSEDARAYFGPLMDLAQATGIPFLLLTHLSRDSQALGRRIVSASRLVWKITHPDPEGQPHRRRLCVDKTYAVKPPPLGMTIDKAGCTFDSNPPSAPEPSKPGRPPEKTAKAIAFLTEALSDGDRKQCELISEWEADGGAKGTVFNAMRAMQADDRLAIDESVKPKMCHLVKNPAEGQEAEF